MTIHEMQEEILRLKKELGVCILAHAYQGQEILEIADYVGDSYGLSVQAKKDDRDKVIMCGVRFMAETCKVLCPDKKVYLPVPQAGCPMAEQFTLEKVEALKKEYPGYTVVCYINTDTEMKTACDVCVTSASAVKICSNIENDKILFLPDPNLGSYVAKALPEKEIVCKGHGCPKHAAMREDDILEAKELHPNALFLVHPECRPCVTAHADYIGSTTGIMDYAAKSDAKEFIIGTENSIVEHLQYAYPEKRFYPLSVNLTCVNMKVTNLGDVLLTLKGEAGEEINLSDDVISGAKRCIDQMIALG